jgi:hypothetical protein
MALDQHYVETAVSVRVVDECLALKIEVVYFSETLGTRGYIPEDNFYLVEVVSSTVNRQFMGSHRRLDVWPELRHATPFYTIQLY